ncbi:MAG TPA: winged helix-turn-helix domain-containing protein [Candidatus Bathyarchaeia archaeon]|nr:winged helix-turn-helix domain-containing protein [Candidatus Bathyarchaeia archaeon]
MLRKRRDTTRIIFEILSLARNGTSKTRIVNRANLNFRLAGKYVSFLVAKEMLREIRDGRGRTQYQLTSTGERLLHFLSEVEKDLTALYAIPLARSAAGRQFQPTCPTLDMRRGASPPRPLKQP